MVAYNAANPPLPVPPQSVLPIDQGPVPLQRQPTAGENAELSPTAMIQNYLSQRGYQPTSENVRRALEANARDPGVISGLRSDQAGPNTGGGAPKTSAQPAGRTPVNEINQSVMPGDRPPGTGDAPPPVADSGSGGGGGLGALILGLLGVPGMARNLGPKPGDPNLSVGMPPQTGAPITASESLGLTGPPPQIEAPPKQLPAPPKQITGPPAPAEAPVAKPGSVIQQSDQSVKSPVTEAIDKAVPPDEAPKPRIRAKAGSSPRVRVPAVRGARL